MKRFCQVFGLLGLLFALCLPTVGFAESAEIDDQAQLFDASQRQQLAEKATTVGNKAKAQLFIVTTDTNAAEPREFSDEYLRDQIGNDANGAVLLLDMNQRQIYLSTSGNMIDYLDDERINQILDEVESAMASGDYYAAANSYLDKTEEFIAAGVPGGHYRVDEATGKITRYKTITLVEGLIAAGGSLIAALAFFIVTKSRYQLKMGGYTYPYRQNAEVQLTKKEDQLVNSFITTRRIPRPKNNDGGFGGGGSSTHSSGGGTFGGGGRSF